MGQEVRGDVRVADLAGVGAGVARARVDAVEGQQRADGGPVAVEEPEVEQLPAVALEQAVDDQLDRVRRPAASARSATEAALDVVLGVSPWPSGMDVPGVVDEALLPTLLDQRRPGGVVPQRGQPVARAWAGAMTSRQRPPLTGGTWARPIRLPEGRVIV